MAIATIALVGCKKNNDPVTPVIPGGGGGEDDPQEEVIPEVDAPAAGYVTFVIEIPKGTECNGVAFKGTTDNSAWTSANEYLDAEGKPASAANCVKFEKIDGNWYKATYKLGAEAWGESDTHPATYLAGKLCLIYTDDSSWEGQAVDWSYVEDYCTADCGIAGDGNVEVYATGLVYVKVGGWNKSECVVEELVARHVVLIVPTLECSFEQPTIVGSFNGWDPTAIPMTAIEEGVKYEATVEAYASDKFKFATITGWDNQIQVLVDDVWNDNGDIAFGNDTEFTIDYSAGKFKLCEEN